MAARKQLSWQDRVRFRGHRGGVIAMHRALARHVMSPSDLITAVMMVILITLIWTLAVPAVCELWVYMMDYGINHLPYRGQLHITTHHIVSFLRFRVPYPSVEPILPDASVWRITGAVTLGIFVGTFFLPSQWIPITYLLRGILFVQATALVYFAVIPAEFPHTPDSYLEGLMSSGLALISILPLLFGLTFFIFQFSMPQKVLLTLMTMGHLVLFFPLQILLQGLILQKTVLFMPMLYIVFGMPLDILIIIAFYAWGMTWNFRALEANTATR
jgi:hypothetical protein